MPEISPWDSFYVIVGSAAAALIGLQFVVMTLIAEDVSVRTAQAGAIYATPTILHFCAVLFLSAAVRAPWPSIGPIAAIWGVAGLVGSVYAIITTWRLGRQEVYTAVIEDWVFHAVLPVAAYLAMLVAAYEALRFSPIAPFVAGGSTLTLLFVGIHNAWDNVAYHVFVRLPKSRAANTTSQPKDIS